MFLRASKLSRFSYMGLFSERYGYIKPSDVIIRETITPEIQNAICSCYDRLRQYFKEYGIYGNEYMEMEKYLWTYFLNRREGEFYEGQRYHVVATLFIEDKGEPWYRKLDLVESTVKYLYAPNVENLRNTRVADKFVKQLNYEFQRLNFAYRVVGQEIIEITSQCRIGALCPAAGRRLPQFDQGIYFSRRSFLPGKDRDEYVRKSLRPVKKERDNYSGAAERSL